MVAERETSWIYLELFYGTGTVQTSHEGGAIVSEFLRGIWQFSEEW